MLRPTLLWFADIGSTRWEIGGNRWIDGTSDRLILVVCVESIGRLDDRGGGSLGLLLGFLFSVGWLIGVRFPYRRVVRRAC